MRGFMNQIACNIAASNAKVETLIVSMTTTLNNMQKEIASFRNEMRDRRSANNVIVDDYQEEATHEKISNAQQFEEMEEKLNSSESAVLRRQLVSVIGF